MLLLLLKDAFQYTGVLGLFFISEIPKSHSQSYLFSGSGNVGWHDASPLGLIVDGNGDVKLKTKNGVFTLILGRSR